LRVKTEHQIEYFDYLIDTVLQGRVMSITPTELSGRGCQFALRVAGGSRPGREVFESLEASGFACDWRYPDIIRVAPVPLYNSFLDIHRFVEKLDELTS